MMNWIELLLGTTSMLTFAMSIIVIVFLVQLMRKKNSNPGKVYKDWILFTGITLLVTSLLYSAVGEPYIEHSGFLPDQVRLLAIYNSFVRFIGVSFLFTWAAIFEAMEIGEKAVEFFTRKKKVG